jgi:hypothetical protein
MDVGALAWLIRIKLYKGTALLCVIAALPFVGPASAAQTITPVIMEYTGKAGGRFELTNDTLTPMAVVLEPRSFSIGPDGKGLFRALDPGHPLRTLHHELSIGAPARLVRFL